jgi:hypothetical protein
MTRITDEKLAEMLVRSHQYSHLHMNAICGAEDIRALIEEVQAYRRQSPAGVEVKPLEWEDADEGMCTKWRAAALGGHYELVSFDKEPGFAVNFHWGRPLSFWFIQGEPDEWGPTGPKMFPTLEDAKAAAQADCDSRIFSSISVKEPEGVTPEWMLKDPAPVITADMVDRACKAYALARYEGTAVWPVAFSAEEVRAGRRNMRAALTAALCPPPKKPSHDR